LKEILGVFSHPKRHPFDHVIDVSFIAVPIRGKLRKPNWEIKDMRWFDLADIDFKNLAFDHAKILTSFLKWRRKKGTYWSTKT